MQRLIVNPRVVYGFMEHLTGVGTKLLTKVEQEGWKDIPPVPCFRIPEDILHREHEFMLIDGNHRLLIARYRNDLLPIALYEPTEHIDPERDGLAYAKHLAHVLQQQQFTDPKRYERIITLYQNRKARIKRDMRN